MIYRVQRGGTRTVTITQTHAEAQAQAQVPIVVKLNGDPGDDGDEDDGGKDSPPTPDKHYNELSCNKIIRVLFDFPIGNVLKDSYKHGDYTYYRANIEPEVYEKFKSLIGNEFTALEPHFFQDKEKIGRGAKKEIPGKNLLILKAEPFVTEKPKKKQVWCFVRCDSNRIMVIPMSKVLPDTLASQRHISQTEPTKPKPGRQSNLAKQHKELRTNLPDAVKRNFEREERVDGGYIKLLDKCPTSSPTTNCKEILKKSCEWMKDTAPPSLAKAIEAYNKRLDKTSTAAWDDICNPQSGGSVKKNRTNKQETSYFGGMPYIIKEVTEEKDKKKTKGYKVCKKDNPEKCFSKTPLPKERAEKQRTAIIISELSRRPAAKKH